MEKQTHKLNIRYRDMQASDDTGKSFTLTFSLLIALIVLFMAWKIDVFLR